MYLMRLDDASEHWNKEKWNRMHDILSQYNIKPIIAIIPNNKDPKLLEYDKDDMYYHTINQQLKEGWTPALHGYNHVLDSDDGGINPVNFRSEFAGKSYDEQYDKIEKGVQILRDLGIHPKIFVVPAHTFDLNTLRALKKASKIKVISDTISNDIYFENGFYFLSQQSGRVRLMKFNITTFCYHPNTTTDEQFIELESFLKMHYTEFIDIKSVRLVKRKKSLFDRIYSMLYFARRKIILYINL